MIRNISRELGIRFQTFSDDWVLELERAGEVHRMIGYQFDLNNAASAHIAQDKVAAYQVMISRDIPAAAHFLLRTKAGDVQWRTVEWADGVVVKPLLGTGGHGVKLFYSEEDAKREVNESGIDAWAASPLLDAGREVRLILLDDQLLLSYQKQPVVRDGLKFFNLSQGATPAPYDPEPKVRQLAQAAQQALGLRICAVDLLQLNNGEWIVLEINSGFMMENYARVSPENKQRTVDLYRQIVNRLFDA